MGQCIVDVNYELSIVEHLVDQRYDAWYGFDESMSPHGVIGRRQIDKHYCSFFALFKSEFDVGRFTFFFVLLSILVLDTFIILFAVVSGFIFGFDFDPELLAPIQRNKDHKGLLEYPSLPSGVVE